jgi:hypothetical protein
MVPQVLNERAVAVMKRMSDKLMGRDYSVEGGQADHSHAVEAQVREGQVGRDDQDASGSAVLAWQVCVGAAAHGSPKLGHVVCR